MCVFKCTYWKFTHFSKKFEFRNQKIRVYSQNTSSKQLFKFIYETSSSKIVDQFLVYVQGKVEIQIKPLLFQTSSKENLDGQQNTVTKHKL